MYIHCKYIQRAETAGVREGRRGKPGAERVLCKLTMCRMNVFHSLLPYDTQLVE